MTLPPLHHGGQEGLASDEVGQSVHLQYGRYLLNGQVEEVATKSYACVVDENVDGANFALNLCGRSGDLIVVGYIDLREGKHSS